MHTPEMYAISITGWCNNIFGCVPTVKDVVLDFDKYVSSAFTRDESAYICMLNNVNLSRPVTGIAFIYVNKKIIIKVVLSGSPADKLGLQVNDIVVKYDNDIISNLNRYKHLIDNVKFGDTKQITIQRGDAMLELEMIYPTRDEIKWLASQYNKGNINTQTDDRH
jgi:S1-C subfamily serine protease